MGSYIYKYGYKIMNILYNFERSRILPVLYKSKI